MKEEFPETLDDSTELNGWVSILSENVITAAHGQAADAESTGDLADTFESRIESEVELEVDDKIDVLSSTHTPFDVLRLTDTHPSESMLRTLTAEKPTSQIALQLAHDALVQEVMKKVEEMNED